MPPNLPPYSIKVSNRVRSVRLQISSEHGLVVTVPAHFNQHLLPGILSEKADWIHKTLEKIKQQPASPTTSLPEKLELLALNETWLVVYRTEMVNRVKLDVNMRARVLTVSGKVSSKTAVVRLVKTWLKARANSVLPGWLDQLSQRTGLAYNGRTIRDQKTRWGSCSSLKNINLNLKLVFLPPHLVDYVIIHELCHTRVLAHSAAFWRLVDSHYPHSKEARKQLREIARKIPL